MGILSDSVLVESAIRIHFTRRLNTSALVFNKNITFNSMSKISYILIAMLLSLSVNGQEATKTVHKGNVLSGSVFMMGHLTSSKLVKYDTRWSQLPGTGWSTGIGLQLNMKKKWGAEIDLGYETSYYTYDHGNFRIRLPYDVLYVDAKVSKFFAWQNDPFKFWYVKVGGAMHFGNGNASSQEAFNFSYSSNVSSDLIYSVMPEVGYYADLSGNHALQLGLLAKISFGEMLVNNLNAFPELNTVSA